LDGRTPLHYAAEAGLVDTCKLLINNFSANSKDNAGHTPLFMAASKGSLRCVSLLLEHKANQLDDSLRIAIQNEKYAVAMAIIRAGADTKFLLGISNA
jgi:ankyrin repeat protein